jgi:hypothetical protein
MAWSRVEAVYLNDPCKSLPELELAFVKIYALILRFAARSFRFLEKKIGEYNIQVIETSLIGYRAAFQCFHVLGLQVPTRSG